MRQEKFGVLVFRNFRDFKHKSWTHEHNDRGETIIYGILKRNGHRCKYQKIYRLT